MREIYCDKGLTFNCGSIDPAPVHMTTGVRARDLHVIEYTTVSLEANGDGWSKQIATQMESRLSRLVQDGFTRLGGVGVHRKEARGRGGCSSLQYP